MLTNVEESVRYAVQFRDGNRSSGTCTSIGRCLG